jgi:hypothetical protein
MQISEVLIILIVSVYYAYYEHQENIENGNKRRPIFELELN